ncbi:MAG: efflux RND transporter periplasmic adaptor subunit [Phycisphaerae bacterium]|nr:efflux RND transporter periplasmic adaptor subunit [Phycisphaerae bacterium]
MATTATDVAMTEPATDDIGIGAVALGQQAGLQAGRLRWWFMGGVVVILAAAAVWYSQWVPGRGQSTTETFTVVRRDFTISLHEKGELKAAKSIDVKCEVEGRSTIIWLVPEGTEVAEGDLLIKLASEQIDDRVRSEQIREANAKATAEAAAKEYEITLDEQASRIRKAELAVQTAEIDIEKYIEGDWIEQKTRADLDVKRAEEVYNRKMDELQDARELYEQYLFTLDLAFVSDLNAGVLSPRLGKVFADHSVTLSGEVTITRENEGEEPPRWLIAEIARRYNARIEEDELRVYHARNFITARELRDAGSELFEAEIGLQIARLRKKVLYKYDNRKDLQQKTSNVAEAQKDLERARKSAEAKIAQNLANKEGKAAEYALVQQQLAKFRRQQAKTEIRAPAAGLVVYDTGRNRWNRREIAEGSEVWERQTIIKLPDTEVMQAMVRVHESKANKVQVGQTVRIQIEGLPGTIFDGKVSKIAPLADSQNQWLNPDLKEYETEVTLATNGYDLKPGITTQVEIMVEHVQDVLAVPVQTVVTKQGRQYVFCDDGDTIEPVQVKLGRSNDEFVEVLDGLAEDDTVCLSISDEDIQRIPEPNDVGGRAGSTRHSKVGRVPPAAT